MKNLAVIVLILLLVCVFGFYLFSYQVRETEVALRTRFGKATEENEIKQPGLYWKLPAPIDYVHKYDSRMRVLEADISETTTKGAVPIIVNTYVVWRIAEPLEFFNSVGTIREAENYLRSQVSDVQNSVIGEHYFSEFVNNDEQKIRFEEIQDQMHKRLAGAVRKDYGIEIAALGIKQLKVNEDTTKNVFERMKAERNRMTVATISEGMAQALKIRTDAENKKRELLATAEARAKAIRGKGDAEAAQYYKMMEADPQLAMFLRDLESVKKILQERSTVVLSADSEPFKLLKTMPDLEPEDANTVEK